MVGTRAVTPCEVLAAGGGASTNRKRKEADGTAISLTRPRPDRARTDAWVSRTGPGVYSLSGG
jgi:hypothetical protein